MFKIIEKYLLAPKIHFAKIKAPVIAAAARPGQFVILRITETGERLPLTIADFDRDEGSISLVFQEMGKSTKLFAAKKSGDTVMDFLGPQGNPSEIENFGRVVIVGGGVGIAPVFPIARALSGSKNHVIAVIGYRSKENVFWEEKMRSVASELVIMTNDGSYGRKGFVTDALSDIINEQKPDRIIAIGPAVMMKAVSELTRPSQVKTIVSLNSLMVCGMGMCGACRVTVGDKTRFTCMDGPEFDGHQVDYDELISRLATYKDEEKICLENYESEECVRET